MRESIQSQNVVLVQPDIEPNPVCCRVPNVVTIQFAFQSMETCSASFNEWSVVQGKPTTKALDILTKPQPHKSLSTVGMVSLNASRLSSSTAMYRLGASAIALCLRPCHRMISIISTILQPPSSVFGYVSLLRGSALNANWCPQEENASSPTHFNHFNTLAKKSILLSCSLFFAPYVLLSLSWASRAMIRNLVPAPWPWVTTVTHWNPKHIDNIYIYNSETFEIHRKLTTKTVNKHLPNGQKLWTSFDHQRKTGKHSISCA